MIVFTFYDIAFVSCFVVRLFVERGFSALRDFSAGTSKVASSSKLLSSSLYTWMAERFFAMVLFEVDDVDSNVQRQWIGSCSEEMCM